MPAITPAKVAKLNSATFTFAEDVNAWNQARLGKHVLTWFNETIANTGPWAGVSVVDTPANRVGFHAFWNNIGILTGSTATPFQYLALMGIFANECRANYKPAAERSGRIGYPGLSYLYDAIPNLKRSYNTLPGNKTALACFRSNTYREAHGAKPLADRLRTTTDARWTGPLYPRADYPTDLDPAVSGYILEADFMKFRGRGFIQTTGRSNYAKLIQYVQAYNGDNNVIDYYQSRWTGRSADEVADLSTNEDWDRLFQETDLIIAAEAIRVHNLASGDYLALAGDPDAAIRNMGRRISGGDAYAAKYRDRMELLIDRILS